MRYTFTSPIYTEANRAFGGIPFNVWEETGLKGNIPSLVSISGLSFECKLIPRGGGRYLIPIPKKILSAVMLGKEYEIDMEPVGTLSRINRDSPYSKEHPVRKIDGIETISIQAGLCGHCCVAMLAGVPLSDVVALMGRGHASWSKILEALDYYGLSYASKAVYPKGGPCQFPRCCIVNDDNSFLLQYKGSFCGVTDDIDPKKTVSYIEILV
ncbi:MAG: DUF1905 domain-containing protein [Sphaerochaetaceae bacterium]|nr:DUF1905 domain-containing protein [Sphaerochaetaceae bacterium]